MSIATELTALQTDITNARTAITTKGGTVTSGGGSSQLATDIATIPSGEFTRWKNRPSGAPNIDLLDLTDFYGMYITLDVGAWKSIKDKAPSNIGAVVGIGAPVYSVYRGHIVNGAFVSDETLYSNVSGTKNIEMQDYWDNYTLIKVEYSDGFQIYSGDSHGYELECIIKSTKQKGRIGPTSIYAPYHRIRLIGFNNSYVYNNIRCDLCEQIEFEDGDFSYQDGSNFGQFIPNYNALETLIIKNINFTANTQFSFSMPRSVVRFEASGLTFGAAQTNYINFKESCLFSVDLTDIIPETVTSLAGLFAESYIRVATCHNKNFTQLTNITNICYYLSNIKVFDFSGCKFPAVNTGTFEFDKYRNATNLQYLRFGEIYTSASFKYSTLLTHDNLVEILNDLGTVTTTQTITMGATNVAKLSAEEIAIATNKGWTVT